VTSDGDTVLSLGMHPSAIDFSRYPGITEQMLAERIEAGEQALRDAGFDIVPCRLMSADPDDGEQRIRACLAEHDVTVVVIGAGLRMAEEHTLLFERAVNLLVERVPGIRFCFNTSPDTTIDALRRWARPRSGAAT
jgi:hypothetical protein